jgi:hypothetical protein
VALTAGQDRRRTTPEGSLLEKLQSTVRAIAARGLRTVPSSSHHAASGRPRIILLIPAIAIPPRRIYTYAIIFHHVCNQIPSPIQCVVGPSRPAGSVFFPQLLRDWLYPAIGYDSNGETGPCLLTNAFSTLEYKDLNSCRCDLSRGDVEQPIAQRAQGRGCGRVVGKWRV